MSAFRDDVKDGWDFFRKSFFIVRRRPVLIIPLFFAWLVVASVTLYSRFVYEFPDYWPLGIVQVFLMFFLMALSICIANLMMLEFVERMEEGKKINFLEAAKEAFIFDVPRVIPIAIAWSFIWFFIAVVRAILRALRHKEDEDDIDEDFSLENAAITLSGISGDPFSWFNLGLNIAEKLIRMTVFMSLPAIAWENRNPKQAFTKSVEIIRTHPTPFLATYTLTDLALIVLCLPLMPVYFIHRFDIPMPELFWLCVILYEGIVWTLGIYLEQMSVGLLYLWHLKWEREGGVGSLFKIPKPSLLNANLEILRVRFREIQMRMAKK